MTNQKPGKVTTGKVTPIRNQGHSRFSPYQEYDDSLQNMDFFHSSHYGDSLESFNLWSGRSLSDTRKFSDTVEQAQTSRPESSSSSSNTTNFYAALDQQRTKGNESPNMSPRNFFNTQSGRMPSQLTQISGGSSHDVLRGPSHRSLSYMNPNFHDVTSHSGLSNHGVSNSAHSIAGFSHLGASLSSNNTNLHTFSSSLLHQNLSVQHDQGHNLDEKQQVNSDNSNIQNESSPQMMPDYKTKLEAPLDKIITQPNFLNQTRNADLHLYIQSPQSALSGQSLQSNHSTNSESRKSSEHSPTSAHLQFTRRPTNSHPASQIATFPNSLNSNSNSSSTHSSESVNNSPAIGADKLGNVAHDHTSKNAASVQSEAMINNSSTFNNSFAAGIPMISTDIKNSNIRSTTNVSNQQQPQQLVTSSHDKQYGNREHSTQPPNGFIGHGVTNISHIPQHSLYGASVGISPHGEQMDQFRTHSGVQHETGSKSSPHETTFVGHNFSFKDQHANQANLLNHSHQMNYMQSPQYGDGDPGNWSHGNHLNNPRTDEQYKSIQVQGAFINTSQQGLSLPNNSQLPQSEVSSNMPNHLFSFGINGSNMNYNPSNNQVPNRIMSSNSMVQHPTLQVNYGIDMKTLPSKLNANTAANSTAMQSQLAMSLLHETALQSSKEIRSKGINQYQNPENIFELVHDSIKTLEKLNTNLNVLYQNRDKFKFSPAEHDLVYDKLLPSVVEQFMTFFENMEHAKTTSDHGALQVDLRHRKINKVVAHSSVYQNTESGVYLVTRNRPISLCVTYPKDIEVDRNSIEWQVYEPMTGRVNLQDIVFNDECNRVEYSIMLKKKRSNVKMKIKLRDNNGKLYETDFNASVVSYCDATFRKKVNSFLHGEYERKCDDVDVK